MIHVPMDFVKIPFQLSTKQFKKKKKKKCMDLFDVGVGTLLTEYKNGVLGMRKIRSLSLLNASGDTSRVPNCFSYPP